MKIFKNLWPYFILMRPTHWIKNIFCVVGLLFSGPNFWHLNSLFSVLEVFLVFCILSSGIYVLNDILDVENDKNHPIKRFRPLASGVALRYPSILLCSSLIFFAVLIGFLLSIKLGIILLIYTLLNIAYSSCLKGVVILDVFIISFGFLLRLVAGIYSYNDLPSTWILLCTFFITLFIGFSKRRSEYVIFIQNNIQRKVLDKYSLNLLDFLINTAATLSLATYSIFTVFSKRGDGFFITVIPVCFGIFYFKYLLLQKNGLIDPQKIIYSNKILLITGLIWISTYLLFSFYNPILFKI